MKFSDLSPQFTRPGADGALEKVQTLAEAHGVWFHCPVSTCGHRILCWFHGRVPDNLLPGPGRWVPSGTGYDDLTLTGSPGNETSSSIWINGAGCCKAHFHITRGEVIMAGDSPK